MESKEGIVKVFESASDALPVEDIIAELIELGCPNSEAMILDALRENILCIKMCYLIVSRVTRIMANTNAQDIVLRI